MKHLLLVILIFFTSCTLTKQERVDNRVVKKIEKIKAKYPDSFKKATTKLVRIDTLIQEVNIQGESRLDTIEVEILLTEYLHDTVRVDRFINRFIEATKDTLQIDTLGLHLWIAGVAVRYTLRKDEAHIVKEDSVEILGIQETKLVTRIPWWIWALLTAAIVVIFMMQLNYIRR